MARRLLLSAMLVIAMGVLGTRVAYAAPIEICLPQGFCLQILEVDIGDTTP